MEMTDQTNLLPAFAKTGAAGIILAILVGLAQVINAWRGGTLSRAKEEALSKQLDENKNEISSLEGKNTEMEKRMEVQQELIHALRHQRDQVHIYAEYLEMLYKHEPKRDWAWKSEKNPHS